MKATQILTTALLIGLVIQYSDSYAQNVAINTTGNQPDASAILDLSSTAGGLLTPRMTNVEMLAISNPATGLLVYQTDGTTGFYYYNGTTWTIIGSSLWNENGNDIYNSNTENVGIGLTDPEHTLHIEGSNNGSNGDAGLYVSNIEPAVAADYGYAIRGYIQSGFGYSIGVRGTSYNKFPQGAGRSYGGYFSAGNAASNWNYGIYAKLLGSNHGAAIVGYNDKDYDWNGHTNGSWAGYFIGDVNITEDLIVEGTLQANTGWHGSSTTMKILPGDFMSNDDYTSYGNACIENDNNSKGVRISTTSQELYAFVAVPEGFNAQAVTIYASVNIPTVIYEVDMTTGTWTTLSTGTTNTSSTINMSSTSTNYLAIYVNTSSTSHTVFGGTVAITN